MRILGLSGRIGSGKDTVADHLIALGLLSRLHVRKQAFAAPLKAACVSLFGLSPSQVHGDRKATPTAIPWATWPLVGTVRPDGGHAMMTAREVMQEFGMLVRRIDPDSWVRQAMHAVPHAADIVVFTDVRFPNEADAIRTRHGGKVVQLTRSPGDDAHASEQAMDGYPFDAVVDNAYQTLNETFKAVDALLEGWGWL